MLNWNKFAPKQKSKPETDEVSLKARKRLEINRADQKKQLYLPKNTIQMIIKKQLLYKTPQSLFYQDKLLCPNLSRGPIDLRTSNNDHFARAHFTSSESESYCQALWKGRNIKTLSSQYNAYLPPRLLWSIRVLRTLQILNISLFIPQFLIFQKVLRSLTSLRNLKLDLKEYDGITTTAEKLEDAFSKLSKELLQSRNLISLKLRISSEEFLPSGGSGNTLLSTVGQMNLQGFEIFFQVSEKTVLDPSKIQAFLEKVQHLSFIEKQYFYRQSVPFRKIFSLSGGEWRNRDAILMKCSSLKSFDFQAADCWDILPQSLGSAKGISEFEIILPRMREPKNPHRDPKLHRQIRKLISEISSLDSLTLTIWGIDEGLSEVHNTLKNLKLKSYSLAIQSTGESFKAWTIPLYQLYQQIGAIQSLEKLYLYFGYVDDEVSLKLLFENMNKLKKLTIIIQRGKKISPSFPFEDLGKLHSLEELFIKYPIVTKADALERLSKLPNLKKIKLKNGQNTEEEFMIPNQGGKS